MPKACINHVSSQWHKSSIRVAKDFIEAVPVDVIMVSEHQKLIEKNRNIISSIISTIIFCGTRDLPLRGKRFRSGKPFKNPIFLFILIALFLNL